MRKNLQGVDPDRDARLKREAISEAVRAVLAREVLSKEPSEEEIEAEIARAISQVSIWYSKRWLWVRLSSDLSVVERPKVIDDSDFDLLIVSSIKELYLDDCG